MAERLAVHKADLMAILAAADAQRTRTADLSFTKARVDFATGYGAKTCDDAHANPSSRHSSSSGNPPLDDDLRRLVEAWPTLPDPVRAGILAMVEVAKGAKVAKH